MGSYVLVSEVESYVLVSGVGSYVLVSVVGCYVLVSEVGSYVLVSVVGSNVLVSRVGVPCFVVSDFILCFGFTGTTQSLDVMEVIQTYTTYCVKIFIGIFRFRIVNNRLLCHTDVKYFVCSLLM